MCYQCYYYYYYYSSLCGVFTVTYLNKRFSRACNVTAVQWLQYTVHVMSFPMKNVLSFCVSTFQTMYAAPKMIVFFSSLMSCFPGMLLRYFLDDFEVVSVTHVIPGITFAFIFHMRSISVVGFLYLSIFSDSLLITFLFPEITTSINARVRFRLLQIMMSGLLLGVVLSIFACWFRETVTLTTRLVFVDFRT